mmetsp:Transcript_100408/g.322033  ORF Transcript_100408/g.322033 Transcript_100408/m.322033 type:complete len:225 (-) Transcript_100408:271-945(-)
MATLVKYNSFKLLQACISRFKRKPFSISCEVPLLRLFLDHLPGLRLGCLALHVRLCRHLLLARIRRRRHRGHAHCHHGEEVDHTQQNLVGQPRHHLEAQRRSIISNLQRGEQKNRQAAENEGDPTGERLEESEGHASVLLARHLVREHKGGVAAEGEGAQDGGRAHRPENSGVVEAEHRAERDERPGGQEAAQPEHQRRHAPAATVAEATEPRPGQHRQDVHNH